KLGNGKPFRRDEGLRGALVTSRVGESATISAVTVGPPSLVHRPPSNFRTPELDILCKFDKITACTLEGKEKKFGGKYSFGQEAHASK
ncbi:MAG TPA: hypothetical protein VF707_17980, partial [Ardenticatenaceae bacterium]